MSNIIAVAENLILIVGLPWLVADNAQKWVVCLDNRGMFSLPFCRAVAVASGGVLAIATAVLAGFHHEVSIASLWAIEGFWHTDRLLTIVERYVGNLLSPPAGWISASQLLFAQMLLVSAGLLAALNFGIAILGWRSAGAVRGLLAHLVLSLSVWMVVTVRVVAALWILHWLNFWSLLIALIVLELRRREEATTRLSF